MQGILSRTIGAAGVALALGAAGPGAALGEAPDGEPREHCRADALEEWWCPASPQGTAVVDKLGRVLCAPGACVETDAGWACSSVPGGSAGWRADEGPVCDGDCRPPLASDCRKM